MTTATVGDRIMVDSQKAGEPPRQHKTVLHGN